MGDASCQFICSLEAHIFEILKDFVMSDIVVGILAFLGAWIGTKRIKKDLVDNYIESRVTKAFEANDNVRERIKAVLSELEEKYTVNAAITDDDLANLTEVCQDIARLSEDGSKEVATTAYLLSRTIGDIKPSYKTQSKESEHFERITISDLVGLIDRTLRLIIDYCDSAAPIPFSVSLKKRSYIKRSLRPYLKDKKFYSLKHQPFGLSLIPNSEIATHMASIVSKCNSPVFADNFYSVLQSNLPIAYELVANNVYMPIEIIETGDSRLFGALKLSLIKMKKVTRFGDRPGGFIKFYYSNTSSTVNFLNNYPTEKIREDFTIDLFLSENFHMPDKAKISRQSNEVISIELPEEDVLITSKRKDIKIRWALLKFRF